MRNVTSKIDSAVTFQRIVHSAMPSPMPATTAVGSDWNRAITATARPGRMVGGPHQGVGDHARERGLGDERGGGEGTGHRPHDRLQPAHRYAEEEGAILVLRGGPHGPTGVGAEEEPPEQAQGHRRQPQHQEVVAPHRVGPHEEAAADGGLDVAHERVEAQADADDQADGPEDLGQADGGHGEHQARAVGEATDHQHVDCGPRGRAHHQTDGDGQPVVPPLGHEQPHGERPGHRTHGAVGEVHDPRGAVDEDEPHGQQGVRRPEDHPLGDDAPGHHLRQRAQRHPVQERVGDHRGHHHLHGALGSQRLQPPFDHGASSAAGASTGRSTTRSGATVGARVTMSTKRSTPTTSGP